LFGIERIVSGAEDTLLQHRARRLSETKLVLDDFKSRCEKCLRKLLPKSPTTGAINYVPKF
jgi:hypothetical protein